MGFFKVPTQGPDLTNITSQSVVVAREINTELQDLQVHFMVQNVIHGIHFKMDFMCIVVASKMVLQIQVQLNCE
jgi:hypothetical protein